MYKIGNVELSSRIILGPMAGVTSLAYREFMKPFGVGLSVTEMVSDCGLNYGNQNTLKYIKTGNIDHPVAIQLFGAKYEQMVQSIDVLINSKEKFELIDINLGCPVPKVTNSGAGSALLKDLNYLKTYMTAIVNKSPVPVTAKIRLGWDENSINVFETIKILESCGVSAIAVHARTRSQLYSGKANYELIRDLQLKMNVPLIISGDIFTLDDAIIALDITKAQFVMVARGGVGNPKLITQINEYLEHNKRISDVNIDENVQNLLTFTTMLIDEKGEYSAMKIMRGLAPKFFWWPGSKKLRIELSQINTFEDLKNILKANNLLS